MRQQTNKLTTQRGNIPRGEHPNGGINQWGNIPTGKQPNGETAQRANIPTGEHPNGGTNQRGNIPTGKQPNGGTNQWGNIPTGKHPNGGTNQWGNKSTGEQINGGTNQWDNIPRGEHPNGETSQWGNIPTGKQPNGGTNTGLVYAFTGEGKGKTSAALGMATRSLLNGEKVVWIAFYKQESWGLSESKLKDKFPNLEMMFVGRGFRIANGQQLTANGKTKIAKVAGGAGVVVDTASEEEHKLAAENGLQLVGEKLQGTKSANGRDKSCFLLVMDEVLNAVSEGLLESEAVIEVLGKRGGTHVVVSGRGGEPTRRLLEGCDLVTECKKIKHPYDTGKLAVKGLDY